MKIRTFHDPPMYIDNTSHYSLFSSNNWKVFYIIWNIFYFAVLTFIVIIFLDRFNFPYNILQWQHDLPRNKLTRSSKLFQHFPSFRRWGNWSPEKENNFPRLAAAQRRDFRCFDPSYLTSYLPKVFIFMYLQEMLKCLDFFFFFLVTRTDGSSSILRRGAW